MSTEQENVTPDDINQDKSEVLFNISSIFAKSLGFFLNNSQGIIVKMEGPLFNPVGSSERVAIINHNGIIRIEDIESDHEDGTILEFEFSEDPQDEIPTEDPSDEIPTEDI